LGVPERLEVLLEVASLVLADGREGKRMEDEEDVGAAVEVGQPHALLVGHREVELGRALTCLDRHPPAPLPLRTADSTVVREAAREDTKPRIPSDLRAGRRSPGRGLAPSRPPCVRLSAAPEAAVCSRAGARPRALPRSRPQTRWTSARARGRSQP